MRQQSLSSRAFGLLFGCAFMLGCAGIASAQHRVPLTLEQELRPSSPVDKGYTLKSVQLRLEKGVSYAVEMKKKPVDRIFRQFIPKGNPRVLIMRGGFNDRRPTLVSAKNGVASTVYKAPASGNYIFVFSRDIKGKLTRGQFYPFIATVKKAPNGSVRPNVNVAYQFRGRLTKDPTKFKRGRQYEFKSLRLQKGKTYTLTLESRDFKPVLLIRKNPTTGAVYAIDKNEGKKRTARIRFTPQETKYYHIEVTSQGIARDDPTIRLTGSFTLSVTPKPLPRP